MEKLWIILVLISLLLLSSCGNNKGEENTASWVIESQNNLSEGLEKESDAWNKLSLAEKFFSKEIWNLKCVMNPQIEWWEINQVLYISWIKMKSETTIKHQWETRVNYMISDGEYTYMWGKWWAFKMKVEDDDYHETIFWEDELEEDGGYDESSDLKTLLEEIPDNKCEQWDVDETMFELPKNIDFQDFSEWFDMQWWEDVNIEWYQNIEGMPNMDDLKDMIPEEYKDN